MQTVQTVVDLVQTALHMEEEAHEEEVEDNLVGVWVCCCFVVVGFGQIDAAGLAQMVLSAKISRQR